MNLKYNLSYHLFLNLIGIVLAFYSKKKSFNKLYKVLLPTFITYVLFIKSKNQVI